MSLVTNENQTQEKQNIVPSFINVAEIARRMGKKKEWLYQRLHNWHVNGKPATFKPDERAQLSNVLLEMWRELADAVGIQNIQKADVETAGQIISAISGNDIHLACIRRLVNAFSFDKGAEDMTEQISALNEANHILQNQKQ